MTNDVPENRSAKNAEKAPRPLFAQLHEEACLHGAHTYIDPSSGYTVITRIGHESRGYCCGNACRHCPWNHQAVAVRSNSPEEPT